MVELGGGGVMTSGGGVVVYIWRTVLAPIPGYERGTIRMVGWQQVTRDMC